MKNIATDF